VDVEADSYESEMMWKAHTGMRAIVREIRDRQG